MKNNFFVMLLVISNIISAQIKVGDNPQVINSTSLLELESTSKVLVISRMTENEMFALTPLEGALVYNTDASCIFYFDGLIWNNLCSSGSSSNIAWGLITGTLADQNDLAAEFQNYVDLTSTQSIGGEKTLTDKLTINTGDPDAQIAEFLGRVRGEDGTDSKDFVTKSQLDASGGASSWGAITGELVDQTDLAAEFENYVNLSNAQSIAGEKTLTDKLTVNTGDTDVQIAEFLGRVKGENGVDPEDFVTKSQLDASGGTSSWGAITGDLVDQTDLVSEFENYVDITTTQTVAGEKTLTDKLTVNTGDSSIQVAEFQGRVKGEDGSDPEDFVTKAQLDNIANGSHFGTEGSIYFADSDLGSPTENPNNLFWDNPNKQLRIGEFNDLMQFGPFSDNLSTINIQGSVSKPVHQATTLTEEHYTTIISWSTYITLPDPTACYGRVYVVKIRPNIRVQIRGYTGYIDSGSIRRLEFPAGQVTQLQSNGFGWEQIN